MPVQTAPDEVLDRKPEHEKKPRLLKPWFNWWDAPQWVAIDLNTGLPRVLSKQRLMQPDPYPSKDAAETGAMDVLEQHKNCACHITPDCYLGAYEEGKSPP